MNPPCKTPCKAPTTYLDLGAPLVRVFVCGDGKQSLEGAWYQHQALEQEWEYEEEMRIMGAIDAEELHITQTDMFHERDGVDPFWPDSVTTGLQEIEIELAPIDWAEMTHAQ